MSREGFETLGVSIVCQREALPFSSLCQLGASVESVFDVLSIDATNSELPSPCAVDARG